MPQKGYTVGMCLWFQYSFDRGKADPGSQAGRRNMESGIIDSVEQRSAR